MTDYSFILPFSIVDEKAVILTAQRNLILSRLAGNTVKGIIPEWAGQWGLIGARNIEGMTAEQSAIQAFKDQTGIDISDSDTATRYLLGNTNTIDLKTENQINFSVLCLFTSSLALGQLCDVIQANLASAATQSDQLHTVKCMNIDDARKSLGPAGVPDIGWREFLVDAYYGGKRPGQLNTEIDVLTNDITTNSKAAFDYAERALSETE